MRTLSIPFDMQQKLEVKIQLSTVRISDDLVSTKDSQRLLCLPVSHYNVRQRPQNLYVLDTVCKKTVKLESHSLYLEGRKGE
jgi:hypothetical protein